MQVNINSFVKALTGMPKRLPGTKLLCVFMLVMAIGLVNASFIMVEPGVPMLGNANLAFGDYDNDGDLDLITIGSHRIEGVPSNQARLYRNDGNWQFSLTDFVFGDFVSGGVSWGDFDNDGWLDVVLSGSPFASAFAASMTLFRNNAGQGFTQVAYPFHNRAYSNHVWADVDNDFDLDIIAIGNNRSLDMFGDLGIYFNHGAGAFQYDTLPYLPDFLASFTGYLSATDFDRDGYLDLSVSAARVYGGIASSGTRVWRQTTSGLYEDFLGNEIGGGSGFEWFDYDSDGDLDFVYTGYQANIGDATILLRSYDGAFASVQHSFPNISDGDVVAADYDNDGYEDLFITGGISMSTIANLYRNLGNRNFLEAGLGLQPVGRSYAFWADLDNDNDLDLIYTGRAMDNYTMFYRNDTATPNQAPSPPNLSYSPDSGFTIKDLCVIAQS